LDCFVGETVLAEETPETRDRRRTLVQMISELIVELGEKTPVRFLLDIITFSELRCAPVLVSKLSLCSITRTKPYSIASEGA